MKQKRKDREETGEGEERRRRGKHCLNRLLFTAVIKDPEEKEDFLLDELASNT